MKPTMLLFLLAACGGALEPPDAGVDASGDAATDASTDGSSADVPDAPESLDGGGACNALVQGAPSVDVVLTTAAAPTPQGGAIFPGLYYLTAVTDYGASTGTKSFGLRSTIEIQGSTMQFVDDLSNVTNHGTISIVTSGSLWTGNQTCPEAATGTEHYSATASDLRLENANGPNDTLEYVYTRQ